jgi:hypothetical protein
MLQRRAVHSRKFENIVMAPHCGIWGGKPAVEWATAQQLEEKAPVKNKSRVAPALVDS